MFNSNPRNACRPVRTIQLQLNNIENTIQNVINICCNQNTKDLVIKMCYDLLDELVTTKEIGIQAVVENKDPLCFDCNKYF